LFLIVPHYFESATKYNGPEIRTCVYLILSGNWDIGHDYVTKVTEKGNVCYFNNWINFAQLISKLISKEAHIEVHSRAKVKRKQSKQKREGENKQKCQREMYNTKFNSPENNVMSCKTKVNWLFQVDYNKSLIGLVFKERGQDHQKFWPWEDLCTLNN